MWYTVWELYMSSNVLGRYMRATCARAEDAGPTVAFPVETLSNITTCYVIQTYGSIYRYVYVNRARRVVAVSRRS